MCLKSRLSGGHFWKLHGFHQAVHSADTDMNAIITGRNMRDPVSADPLVVVRIDVKDSPADLLILNGSCSRGAVKMPVVSTSVYIQYAAQGFNGVLRSEPVDGI